MTRKDFVLIADTIRHMPIYHGDYLQRQLIAQRFAEGANIRSHEHPFGEHLFFDSETPEHLFAPEHPFAGEHPFVRLTRRNRTSVRSWGGLYLHNGVL
jgi:hypothetical protein